VHGLDREGYGEDAPVDEREITRESRNACIDDDQEPRRDRREYEDKRHVV